MSKPAIMRRAMTRRLAQVSSAALLAGSAVMLLMPHAHASIGTTTSPDLLQQAWFWQNTYEQANPPVAQDPPATEPPGVPEGDLGVAFTGSASGGSSKMTALSWNISALTPGTVINDFTFTLTLDASNTSATNFDTTNAAIVACQPTRLWPAEMQGDYTDEPTVDCTNKVKPTVSGNNYTFKIPTIAQSWIDDQNIGVAILNDPDNSSVPFQLVFTGGKTVKATMDYTPETAPAPGNGGGTATGATSGSTGTSTLTGTGGPTSVPPPVSAPTGPTTGTAQPPAVTPQVAPTNLGNSAPAAAVKPTSSAPTSAFWLAGIGLALVLLITSLVLGDPSPAPTTAERSRLDRVLRDRSTDSFSVRSA
jgi:hypothetical protein